VRPSLGYTLGNAEILVPMIVRNLLRRRTRSALTVLGVALGVAAIVALTAVGAGMASGFGDLFGSSDADLTLSQADAYDLFLSSVDESIGEEVRRLPQVASVAGIIYSGARLEAVPFFLVFGYEPGAAAVSHYKMTEGRPLARDREIIIGRGAATNLAKQVGDSLPLYENAFRIVGIYETGEAFEEAGGVITLADAQAIFQKPRQVSLFQVRLRDPSQAERVRERIEARHPDVLVSLGSGAGERKNAYEAVEALALGIGLVAAVVGGLGMMNAIMMSVFERTREIGVLRALGWRRRAILGQILGESLALSAAGGALGMLGGVGLVRLLALSPGVSSIVVGEFSARLFLQAGLIALVLGLVAGFVPAWWAARLQPLEALRMEGGVGGGSAGPGSGRMGGRLAVPWHRLPHTARDLARRRSRTGLTVGGIAIGVAVVVALGAITEGFVDQFAALMGEGGADLALMQANIADMSLSTIDESVGRRIAAIPEVEAVAGMVLAFVSTPDVPLLLVYGLEPNEFAVDAFVLVEGRPMRGRGEALLGRPAAGSLGKGVGDLVRISGRPFRVVGLFETGVGYQDAGTVIDLREAQALFEKPRQVSYYQVRLADPARADAVRGQIAARFPEVAVSRSADLIESSEDIKITRAIVGVLSSIAVIVGGIGVMNTVLMSVFERTREIGVLRALGWRRRRIVGQVLAESLLLGAIGGAVGIVGGVLAVLALGLTPGFGGILAGSFRPAVFAQGAAVALGLGALGALYPAWRATGFRPAEALRYE